VLRTCLGKMPCKRKAPWLPTQLTWNRWMALPPIETRVHARHSTPMSSLRLIATNSPVETQIVDALYMTQLRTVSRIAQLVIECLVSTYYNATRDDSNITCHITLKQARIHPHSANARVLLTLPRRYGAEACLAMAAAWCNLGDDLNDDVRAS